MKAWYQSRTIIANILLAALAIVAQVSNVFPVSDHPKIWVTITTVLNIGLRLITGQPIGTTSTDSK